MYPNLYYVFQDWFGVEWSGLKFLNTFGLMVAAAFVVAAIVLSKELQRKEKEGLLTPREEMITVGKPAGLMELIINAVAGFLFGYKLIGLFMSKPAGMNPQEYIFSRQGSIWGGLFLAAVLVILKWRDKEKQKLEKPDRRNVRIWPHDRVGDIIILGLIFGLLGAKLFDNFENWDDFVKDPMGRIFSPAGLTYYGGLILAAIAIGWYAVKKGIKLAYLMDAVAPALMIAYAVGRIGCQVSGDGDWGVYNSAYVTDAEGKVVVAAPGDFQKALQKNSIYFLDGRQPDTSGKLVNVTDRISHSLESVPNRYFKGPSFLPVWMFAYTYPHNVNADGVAMANCQGDHCRALPLPVFPTPLYEIIACTFLFLVLWALRKRIHIPGVLWGIYLILNGLERFTIELIRVNNTYSIFGFHPTQAELISAGLVFAGIIFIIVFRQRAKRVE